MFSEDKITLSIIKDLKKNGWCILTYDFPQSGTGLLLKPNHSYEKNKGSIIPDIVAVKDNKGLLLENKNRFYYEDFKKIHTLRTTNIYRDSLVELFGGTLPDHMWYGIGIPDVNKHIKKATEQLNLIDILATVSSNQDVNILYPSNFIL